MFFFALHDVLPACPNDDGKRNCRTFLLGVFLYAAAYVAVHNAGLGRDARDGFVAALFAVALADAVVMAWTYRNHYGRSILREAAGLRRDDGADQRD